MSISLRFQGWRGPPSPTLLRVGSLAALVACASGCTRSPIEAHASDGQVFSGLGSSGRHKARSDAIAWSAFHDLGCEPEEVRIVMEGPTVFGFVANGDVGVQRAQRTIVIEACGERATYLEVCGDDRPVLEPTVCQYTLTDHSKLRPRDE